MKLSMIPVAVAGLALIVLAAYIVARAGKPLHPAVAANHHAELAAVWKQYKQTSWDSSSGRTIDHSAQDITTSEGQGYTLLRAVWSNDHPTFDSTWQWTRTNLQRDDKLFNWKWGQRPDGSWGVLSAQGGNNTASDADSDIALALLLADKQWPGAGYGADAKAIIGSIWQHDTVLAAGKRYLAADDLESQKTSGEAVINPSYFAPYAYRLFAGVDRSHDWQSLLTDNYSLLRQAMAAKLGQTRSASLPPDWLQIDVRDGSLSPAPGKSTAFGYDAFRTVWRTALDYQWNHSKDASQVLGQWGILQQAWSHQHELVDGYSHAGQATGSGESLGFYGGTLGYFQYQQARAAQTIVREKLAPLYSVSSGQLTRQLNYYDNNWVWFGLALYDGTLNQPAGGQT